MLVILTKHIIALFAGEGGMGKTMATGVVVNNLDFARYQIGLGQVVSKYIGKMETNLRQICDAVKDGSAISSLTRVTLSSARVTR